MYDLEEPEARLRVSFLCLGPQATGGKGRASI
jgi:hypothetical protein